MLVLLCGACNETGEPWDWALRPGTYSVSPSFCGATGEAPEFPTPAYQSTLFAFDQLTTHQMTVERRRVIEVIADTDCRLTLTRSTFQNFDGIFSLRGDRVHTFEPAGCAFSVLYQGQQIPVGQAHSDLFADQSTVKDEEIPYEVSADGEGFLMTSRDLSSLNELWQAYGCALPDRLKWRATRIPN